MPIYDPALEGLGNLGSALLLAPQMARKNRMEEEDRALRAQAHRDTLAQALQIRQDADAERKAERDYRQGRDAKTDAFNREKFDFEKGLKSEKADREIPGKPVPPGVFSSLRDSLLANELAQGDRIVDPESKIDSYRAGYNPSNALQFGMVQQGIDPLSGKRLDEAGILRESLRIHPIEPPDVNNRARAFEAQQLSQSLQPQAGMAQPAPAPMTQSPAGVMRQPGMLTMALGGGREGAYANAGASENSYAAVEAMRLHGPGQGTLDVTPGSAWYQEGVKGLVALDPQTREAELRDIGKRDPSYALRLIADLRAAGVQ